MGKKFSFSNYTHFHGENKEMDAQIPAPPGRDVHSESGKTILSYTKY